VLQLRKTLEAGESVQLAGALPLSVVLGRADVVDVMVRGERLDVTAMTRDNVARFEVK
jgi:cytoskeleton protein RodZ